ncbi:MAG: glutamine-hydrolyzing carbamoyl-phosphate synthase small subunit [Betaproteobacteria bacterium]|nr:glutamine-hydrolyzing carbamoyl-phosphate synthase small subunit [Betaproteobacteria bacterium]
MVQSSPALLVLADGSVFRGTSIGTDGQSMGEVVFNTAMTGYQEILTDPSYMGQMVTLTYPHIGNTGTNEEDAESLKCYAAGLVIRDLPKLASNWRMTATLPEYLKRNGVVAIANIDTRRLTRLTREKGAQNGCIFVGEHTDANIKLAHELANAAPAMSGLDLAKVVSCKKSYEWNQSTWALGAGYARAKVSTFHVVAFDYGIKHNILRMLAERGCKITVLPAQATSAEALALKPDGVFLSNGPGDPEPCDYAIKAIREIITADIPVFGICLGHQLLALASGAKTVKMKFGHHGANHPVQDLETRKVYITSQNHGFAADEKTLPANVRVTHISLFDGTCQGIERTDKRAFSFQGHPEASPGPHEVGYLFDRFVTMMGAARG